MAHDINSPGVWRPGQRGETQAEKLRRMKTGPATTDEAYDFEKNYKAEQDATRTVNPQAISGELTIKKIILPNETKSFTTKDDENEIQIFAELCTAAIPKEQEKNIRWELDNDPLHPGVSKPPKTENVVGKDVKIKIVLPIQPAGRNWIALYYRVRAKLDYNGKAITSEWMSFGQDEIDMLRQQYIDMGKAKIPLRKEFIDSGKSTYFTLAEGACNCGHHRYHLWSIMNNLDIVRKDLGQPMRVNSGYRCPLRNAATTGSAIESLHIYGKASDIAVFDFNKDTVIDKNDWDILAGKAKVAGASVEEYAKTGTWVHMGWRT